MENEIQTEQSLMIELDGADEETIQGIAREKGPLPVRSAMLGLATVRRGVRSLWYGYPPGIFIGYKWKGDIFKSYVLNLADCLRNHGYRVFLDLENLDDDADDYFEIPQFITNLQNCEYYLLLLSGATADNISARKGKTTWIFDEYQHALRLEKAGKMTLIPVLIETNGMIGDFQKTGVLDITDVPDNFEKVTSILPPNPLALNDRETQALAEGMASFDGLFLKERWSEAEDVLNKNEVFNPAFDFQFRRLLLALYTANGELVDAFLDKLLTTYGKKRVFHFYKGYCQQHEIPVRLEIN